MTLSISDTQHIRHSAYKTLSIYDTCITPIYHYAQGHFAMLLFIVMMNVILLSVVMLSVVILSVVMLSVVTPDWNGC